MQKMDKEDNIRRIQQIQQLKKEQIMAKIEADNRRTEMIRTKRQQMMAMKTQLLRELDA